MTSSTATKTLVEEALFSSGQCRWLWWWWWRRQLMGVQVNGYSDTRCSNNTKKNWTFGRVGGLPTPLNQYDVQMLYVPTYWWLENHVHNNTDEKKEQHLRSRRVTELMKCPSDGVMTSNAPLAKNETFTIPMSRQMYCKWRIAHTLLENWGFLRFRRMFNSWRKWRKCL